MRDTARPAVVTLDVETDDGCHVAVLAPFARWDGDVAVYSAVIGSDLAARTALVTASGVRCHTEIKLRFMGGDDGE